MKEEILAQLRSAEEATARRVEQAKIQATDVVSRSQKEAAELLRTADESSRRDQQAQLSAEREQSEKERARILQAGAAAEAALRQSYAKNVDAHVLKAVESFKRSLDA